MTTLKVLCITQSLIGFIGLVFSGWCLGIAWGDWRHTKRAGYLQGPEHQLALEQIFREALVLVIQIALFAVGVIELYHITYINIICSDLEILLEQVSHSLLIFSTLCLVAKSVVGITVREMQRKL